MFKSPKMLKIVVIIIVLFEHPTPIFEFRPKF